MDMHAMCCAPRAGFHAAHRVSILSSRMAVVPAVRRGDTDSTTASLRTPGVGTSPSSARQLAGVGTSTSAQALGWDCGHLGYSMRKRAPYRSIGRSPADPPGFFVSAVNAPTPDRKSSAQAKLISVPLCGTAESTCVTQLRNTGTLKTTHTMGVICSHRWLSKNVLTNIGVLSAIGVVIVDKYYHLTYASWQGLTFSERCMHVPIDLWAFYVKSGAAQPLLVAAIITGITYALADWNAKRTVFSTSRPFFVWATPSVELEEISQTYEGRFALDFELPRLARAGAIGFFLLGPLANYYYTLQDAFFVALRGPVAPLWDVPAHILLDQTLYTALYTVVFYMAVGLGRGDK
eukprot:5132945-Pyramimonas_sp.AAC.1